MTDAAWASCGLAGWGVVRVPWGEIPQWRRNPGPAEGLRIAHLKLADEQTVLALAAILQACRRAGWPPTAFGDWGVLAAPKYMGRARLTQAAYRFQKQGVRTMSPLVIPALSQHSVAGTVCMILGCHGPNFGVSGASTPVGELLLNGLSVFEGQACPGVWAVMTAWDPEPIPDGAGQILGPATGIGVALALTPDAAAGAVRLVGPDRFDRDACENNGLLELADFLEKPGSEASRRFGMLGGGYLEVTPGQAAAPSVPLRQAG